jgi:2-polyprenyl-3-methyl-5-hydroxy-6-metoxy-1,4-benzoquinol methylase
MIKPKGALKNFLAFVRIYTKNLSIKETNQYLERLNFFEKRLFVDPWYHNFSPLGIETIQRPGTYVLNQQSKQNEIFELLEKSVKLCHEHGAEKISGIDLASADGFYTNYAVMHGIDSMVGVDINKVDLAKSRVITKLLKNQDKARFKFQNVFDIDKEYDMALCAGLLYHLSDPEALLTLLSKKIKFALVIQTIYSLRSEDPNYFVTPSPTRTWGCRFSYDYLINMVTRSGWSVVESKTAIAQGNAKPDDRGTAFLFCLNKKLV